MRHGEKGEEENYIPEYPLNYNQLFIQRDVCVISQDSILSSSVFRRSFSPYYKTFVRINGTF